MELCYNEYTDKLAYDNNGGNERRVVTILAEV